MSYPDPYDDNFQRGVTLVELILVIAIVAILGVSTSPFLSRFILQMHFDTTRDKVVSTIRKSQEYAMSGKAGTTWGVCMSGSALRLYGGTCASPTIQENFSIPTTVTISGLSDITFTTRGEPSSVLTVSLSTSIESGSVSINSAGGMEIN